MSSVAYIGRGSSLKIQTATSPVTWTSVAQLQKIALSGIKVTTDDITNLDSPSSFKEFIAVLVEAGEVSFDGILNPAAVSQIDLLNLCQAMTLSNFEILLSDAVTYIKFSGYVTEYVPAVVETTKATSFSGKITISGPLTFGS